MSSAKDYADSFSELFRGNMSVRGVHIPDKNVPEGEKAKGKSFTKDGQVTVTHYLKHLHGAESMGIVPIDENNNVRFGVIDVDVYPLDPTLYLRLISRMKVPFVGFRSKSGGLHLYIFFAEDTPAEKVVPLLGRVRALLGLPPDTEIFPKQTRLMENSKGNWINLPYFSFEDTPRYAYGADGEALPLGEALEVCRNLRTTHSAFLTALDAMPLSEAPPCLQTMYIHGGADSGARNVFLFNCATYLKARFGEDYAEKLHMLNTKMDAPLPYEELDRTIIASHNRGDYSYQCKDPNLSVFCERDICRTRTYGKGSGTVSDLSFEQLIQIACSDPYYKWRVSGVEMLFYSETELMNQTKFRELCLRHLHHVPNRLKEPAWNEILNRALSNLQVEEMELQDDLSTDSLWLTKVGEFFGQRKAQRPSQVEDGLVWLSSQGKLFFKGSKLLEYLDNSGLFRMYKNAKHLSLLKGLGATKTKLRYPDYNKSARVWSIKAAALEAQAPLTAHLLEELDKEESEDTFSEEPINFTGNEKF